jgi:hypothetical protein
VNITEGLMPADTFNVALAAARNHEVLSDTGASEALSELLELVATSTGDEQKLNIAAARAQYRAEVARDAAARG